MSTKCREYKMCQACWSDTRLFICPAFALFCRLTTSSTICELRMRECFLSRKSWFLYVCLTVCMGGGENKKGSPTSAETFGQGPLERTRGHFVHQWPLPGAPHPRGDEVATRRSGGDPSAANRLAATQTQQAACCAAKTPHRGGTKRSSCRHAELWGRPRLVQDPPSRCRKTCLSCAQGPAAESTPPTNHAPLIRRLGLRW